MNTKSENGTNSPTPIETDYGVDSTHAHKSIRLSAVGRVVAIGLSQLIRGQQQFAHAFDLAKHIVFPKSNLLNLSDTLENQIAKLFVNASGSQILENIFLDLLMHQLALTASLETIVKAITENTVAKNSMKTFFKTYGTNKKHELQIKFQEIEKKALEQWKIAYCQNINKYTDKEEIC